MSYFKGKGNRLFHYHDLDSLTTAKMKGNKTYHTHTASDGAEAVTCYTYNPTFNQCMGPRTYYLQVTKTFPYNMFKGNKKAHNHGGSYTAISGTPSNIKCYNSTCSSYQYKEVTDSTTTKTLSDW